MSEPIVGPEINKTQEDPGPTHNRKDIHIGRRLFHFLNAFILASLYFLFLDHKQLVYILGTLASVLYLLEQIRIHYPEVRNKLAWSYEMFLRAEERLKESAAIPYLMGVMLTVLTFPKTAALIALYTLAIGDPMSAIVGIRFGRTKLFQGKSLEGSLAFLVCSFGSAFAVIFFSTGEINITMVIMSLIIACGSTVFEMLPLRIDDNLTIPLFTGLCSWIVLASFGILV